MQNFLVKTQSFISWYKNRSQYDEISKFNYDLSSKIEQGELSQLSLSQQIKETINVSEQDENLRRLSKKHEDLLNKKEELEQLGFELEAKYGKIKKKRKIIRVVLFLFILISLTVVLQIVLKF